MISIVGPLTLTKLEQVKTWLLSKQTSERGRRSSRNLFPEEVGRQGETIGPGVVLEDRTPCILRNGPVAKLAAAVNTTETSQEFVAGNASSSFGAPTDNSASLPEENPGPSVTRKAKAPILLETTHVKGCSLVSAPLRQPRLLLVDDNAINLKTIGMYARKCSTLPNKIVDGGQAAIDAYIDAFPKNGSTVQPYDVVFLNLSMPEVSGFDVAEKIRQTEKSSGVGYRVYICALTGLASDKDRDRAYAAGVNDYPLKPANAKNMQAVIARWRETAAN